jgi:hypothetical protein
MVKLTNELALLAATRAATSPDRAEWQNDILLTAVVETLTQRGPSSRKELLKALRETWSSSMTGSILDRALATGVTAGLIEKRERGSEPKWLALPAARDEAGNDRKWAMRALSAFQAETLERLRDEFGEKVAGTPVGDRVERITAHLVAGIGHATSFLSEAADHDLKDMRAVRLNLTATLPEIRERVHPAELGESVAALLVIAADPKNSYGDDIFRLMITGHLLYAMVAREDIELAPAPDLLVLDTSELVGLIDDSPIERELFKDFLQSARDRGCRLVVTAGVEHEWIRLWEQADKSMDHVGAGSMPEWAASGVDNPILRSFEAARAGRAGLQWRVWARSERRSLHKLFEALGVPVDFSPADIELDEELVSRLTEDLSQTRPGAGRPIKFPAQAATDARSAATVAAVRRASPGALVPSAWFIAADSNTAHAYAGAVPEDPYPVATTSRTWLLFYSAFSTVESPDRAEFAQKLADSIRMESFLSVAAAYTANDLALIQESLGDEADYDEADAQDAVIAAFSDPRDYGDDSIAVAYLRRRSKRRDRRALEATSRAESETRAARSQVQQAQSDVQRVERGSARTKESDSKTIRSLFVALWLVAYVAAALGLALVHDRLPVEPLKLAIWTGTAGVLLVIELLRYWVKRDRKGAESVFEALLCAVAIVFPYVYEWLTK